MGNHGPIREAVAGRTTSQQADVSFARVILFGVTAKFAIDTGIQIFNPYLATFAEGLGVDVIVMGRLISLVSAMGIIAPLLGALADRLGYRLVMRLALLSGALGALLTGSSAHLFVAAIGLVLMGIGFAIFAPMLHAYLSAIVPYQQRARGIGMVEYSWALANIVGLSLAGQLIALTNWRLPFFVLSAGMATAWLAYSRLPPVPPARKPQRTASLSHRRHWAQRVRAYFDLGPNARSAWASILTGAFNFFASLHIVIVHGVWLAREYGLGPASLGLIALVMGIADLCGSVLVSLISDRVGKRRAVLLGTSGSLLVYLALPMLNVGLATAILSLILLRFAFEFSIVSNISLLSEQVPDQRGKVLTLSAVFYLTSNALVGFTGPWAYTRFGVWGLGPVSAAAVSISLLIIWRWVREAKGEGLGIGY